MSVWYIPSGTTVSGSWSRSDGVSTSGNFTTQNDLFVTDESPFYVTMSNRRHKFVVNQAPQGSIWGVSVAKSGTFAESFVVATKGNHTSSEYRFTLETDGGTGLTSTVSYTGTEPLTFVSVNLGSGYINYDINTIESDPKCILDLRGTTGSVPNAAQALPFLSAFLYHVGGWAFPYADNPPIINPPPTPDPYGALTGGGTGSLGGTPIPVPALPTISAANVGLYSLFAPSPQEMRDLADFLWTDSFSGIEILQAIVRMTADPSKLLISLAIIPSQGVQKGSPQNIRVGPWELPHTLTPLLNQYYDVDCGSLTFDPKCADSFLDYAPYTKISLYLPYIGVRQMDANDFIGHTITVKYRCDAASGACVAYVIKDNTVMYQFSGSVAVNIPLSSADFSNGLKLLTDLNSSSVSLTQAINGASNAPRVTSESYSARLEMRRVGADTSAQAANGISALSPSVLHSGAIGNSSGLLGVQIPYVIREVPSFETMEKFNQLTGYPLNQFRKLSDLYGLTSVEYVHVEGFGCLAEERQQIESLLKSGVIL